jgi:hypothetical protein
MIKTNSIPEISRRVSLPDESTPPGEPMTMDSHSTVHVKLRTQRRTMLDVPSLMFPSSTAVSDDIEKLYSPFQPYEAIPAFSVEFASERHIGYMFGVMRCYYGSLDTVSTKGRSDLIRLFGLFPDEPLYSHHCEEVTAFYLKVLDLMEV